jgi:hypothetical protein
MQKYLFQVLFLKQEKLQRVKLNIIGSKIFKLLNLHTMANAEQSNGQSSYAASVSKTNL